MCSPAGGKWNPAAVSYTHLGGVSLLGPAITFVSPELWANIVKLFSQVVVIVSNYVFSKILIFTKKAP